MFWRLLRQMIVQGRGRLAIALVALVSGATVSAALLNLQFDAERKITRELRTLGPNVLVRAASASPPDAATGASPDEGASLIGGEPLETLLATRTGNEAGQVTAFAPSLYVIVRAAADTSVVLAGTWLDALPRMNPSWQIEGTWPAERDAGGACVVGQRAAARLGVHPGSEIELRYADRQGRLVVSGIVSTGGTEDDQVFAGLEAAQQLAVLPGKASVVQMSVAGTPQQVEQFAGQLAGRLPGLDVRPLRQMAQAEGLLLGRVHSLLFWSVGLILVLTSLCVLSTTTALAVERRADVGLMKALGGGMNRVIRLFLAEAGLLGAAGGLAGAVLGTMLSAWMGREVFGTATSVRPEVIPLTVAVMIAVALAGALPLRLLAHVRPAAVLREGE